MTPEANQRLTAITAALLLLPLGAVVVTGFRLPRLLPEHYFLGLLLVPPVLLKMGSTGYRFARYYLNDPRYRLAGPPELLLRLLAPVVVLSTVALFATGIELWLFGLRFGLQWLSWHEAAFLVWFFATGAHVLAHLERTRQLAAADVRGGDPLPGAITRRSLLVASLVVGLLLAAISLPWWSPFGLLES